jgi:hypothetical protein
MLGVGIADLFAVPRGDEEAPKPAPVIETVSARDRPDPAFRTPSQLNMRPQKPPGGDLDMDDPVADDLKPYFGVFGPHQVARLILRAACEGNSAWVLVR